MSSPLTRRLQILLDEERYQRIAARSARLGVSVASLIRRAIDRAYPPDDHGRRQAGEKILDAEPMDVPEDPADLKRELNEARSRRM